MDADYFYSPGYLVTVKKEISDSFKNEIINTGENSKNVFIQKLKDHAQDAVLKSQAFQDSPFKPSCLTIYLNQKCSLDCIYCFSNLDISKIKSYTSIQAIRAAINLVAKNCIEENLPLTIGFHGGGEPILSWKTIEKLQPLLIELSNKNSLPLLRYISTNGVMSEERALWLSQNVDLVGISCDGPEDIQSIQRPLQKNNRQTSTYYLERTANLLHSKGTPIQVRVTLTKETFNRQTEICDYLCRTLHPESIHVEPVYMGGKSKGDFLTDLNRIDEFVQSFSQAKSLASTFNVRWEMSTARINNIHTAYCNIFRQVLQLVPGNAASACFKYVNSEQIENTNFKIGWFDSKTNSFILDQSTINSLRSNFRQPMKCAGCFLEYQCTHNCPNNCCFEQEETTDFLCQLSRRIVFDDLKKWMTKLRHSSQLISGTILK